MTAGTTNFPTSLDSHTGASPLGFGEVNNQAYTLSTAAHTNSVTTITVASTTKFPSKGYLVIKREIVSYTGTTATTFTGCTRGVGGTTAAAFGSSTLVEQVPVAANHNDLAAGLVAVETKVGITSSTPTANKVLGADGTGISSWRQVATTDLANGAVSALQAGSNIGADVNATTATWVDAGVSISYTAAGEGKVIIPVSGLMRNDSGTGHRANLGLWDGTVGSGTLLAYADGDGLINTHSVTYLGTLTGSHTLRIGINNPAATGTARLYAFSLSWGVLEVKR